MNWTQIIDPFDNIALSALVAVVPILFIFWALIIKKMKGYQASLLAVVIALFIAIIVYKMLVNSPCYLPYIVHCMVFSQFVGLL